MLSMGGLATQEGRGGGEREREVSVLGRFCSTSVWSMGGCKTWTWAPGGSTPLCSHLYTLKDTEKCKSVTCTIKFSDQLLKPFDEVYFWHITTFHSRIKNDYCQVNGGHFWVNYSRFFMQFWCLADICLHWLLIAFVFDYSTINMRNRLGNGR